MPPEPQRGRLKKWLLQQINNTPTEWKVGTYIFIPIPGKTISSSNLRPITLRSNAGKLFEGMIYYGVYKSILKTPAHPLKSARLPTQTINSGYPPSAIWRGNKGAQRIATDRVVAAADLQKAFDNVTHDFILQELAKTKCETAICNIYVPSSYKTERLR